MRHITTSLLLVLALIAALNTSSVSAYSHSNVLPTAPNTLGSASTCKPAKVMVLWLTGEVIRNGFHIEQYGNQASVKFRLAYMSLDVATGPSAEYQAARITEIDTSKPINQRTKCWQSSSNKKVVATYILRFDQATINNMTENMLFWNAPLASPANPEPAQPLSAIGVTRSFGTYRAVVAQDLDTATYQGTYIQQNMPTWLNPTRWHAVRVTYSQTEGKVEVAQGFRGFTTVVSAPLPRPYDALGLEFSVDNEVVPGVYAPVTTPDGADIAYLSVRYQPTGFGYNSEDSADDAAITRLMR